MCVVIFLSTFVRLWKHILHKRLHYVEKWLSALVRLRESSEWVITAVPCRTSAALQSEGKSLSGCKFSVSHWPPPTAKAPGDSVRNQYNKTLHSKGCVCVGGGGGAAMGVVGKAEISFWSRMSKPHERLSQNTPKIVTCETVKRRVGASPLGPCMHYTSHEHACERCNTPSQHGCRDSSWIKYWKQEKRHRSGEDIVY